MNAARVKDSSLRFPSFKRYASENLLKKKKRLAYYVVLCGGERVDRVMELRNVGIILVICDQPSKQSP